MKRKIPIPLLWIIEPSHLEKKKYLKDLDFIKQNTCVNHITLTPREGVQLNNLQQCHEAIKELTDYAHKIGLEISLHLCPHNGFYNAIFITGNHPAIDQAELFPIPNPEQAPAIVNDIELLTDDDGYAQYSHKAVWGRSKIMPIYSRILKAYSFKKTGEGFYQADTLEDITPFIRITESRTHSTKFEVDLGKKGKNKNVFVLLAQYYNSNTPEYDWESLKSLIDAYADIPLDGICLDEYGYILLNTRNIEQGTEPPFRGRLYTPKMFEYYKENLSIDLHQILFEMRYAPENDERIRIKAINTYFENLRVFPLEVEKNAFSYAKQLFGENAYIACHNTFHNNLESDEIWRTACNWWDIPRDFGHTDENIGYPVRLGVMLARQNPIGIDMYYSKDAKSHYSHMIEGAPFNSREFHHAYGDFYWGNSFTDLDFLKDVKKIDRHISYLDDFQKYFPKMDLLIIFGASAQNNWYPNYKARNTWDIDGSLHVQAKCDAIWKAGYRCALVPDYAIEDGRITLQNDKIVFNGHEFTHCLFLYPKYAKKETYNFLNNAEKNNVKLAVIGNAGVDFDGNEAMLTAKHYDNFSLEILQELQCEKSAIENGCVYSDGSFALVTNGILTGEKTNFDFEIDGIRYSGYHTGLLAYRAGETAFATKGSALFVNGKSALLKDVD